MSTRHRQIKRDRYHFEKLAVRPDLHINKNPPNDGPGWECQCARCGSSMQSITCDSCGGDGQTEPGELFEQDPLYYDINQCDTCNGDGGWQVCVSSEQWCRMNPIKGRRRIRRGLVQWFKI